MSKTKIVSVIFSAGFPFSDSGILEIVTDTNLLYRLPGFPFKEMLKTVEDEINAGAITNPFESSLIDTAPDKEVLFDAARGDVLADSEIGGVLKQILGIGSTATANVEASDDTVDALTTVENNSVE